MKFFKINTATEVAQRILSGVADGSVTLTGKSELTRLKYKERYLVPIAFGFLVILFLLFSAITFSFWNATTDNELRARFTEENSQNEQKIHALENRLAAVENECNSLRQRTGTDGDKRKPNSKEKNLDFRGIEPMHFSVQNPIAFPFKWNFPSRYRTWTPKGWDFLDSGDFNSGGDFDIFFSYGFHPRLQKTLKLGPHPLGIESLQYIWGDGNSYYHYDIGDDFDFILNPSKNVPYDTILLGLGGEEFGGGE